ncbi:MAG: hypothetical protein CMN87_12865 [Stappia sp.]|uniref:TRAP transporter small permease n=1 Tax=Stappia sp. TaxID=1870903 RepID=UPI000C6AB87B|nr:TRAP transporter small permease subunit [Stappia sp.]MAA98288.1 hypothetical protein [Stappia sp.]MBM20893.1 hypothetical protein [Stappia sp.]|tara:strand:- start:83 stop:784 length:702 start_codon:yes stop_codon:yes gene_type:complete
MTPLLSPLRRTSDVVNRVVIAVCAVLLALMLVISAASVVLELALAAAERVGQAEIFHEGAFAWLYRNTRPSLFSLLLPWFAMLSITVAFKYGEHIAILALRRGLPRAALGLVRWICFTAIALFAVALVWYGVEFASGATNVLILSDTLQVSQRWTAAAVPVAGAVLSLHLVDGLALLEERGVLSLEDPMQPHTAGTLSDPVRGDGDAPLGDDGEGAVPTGAAKIASQAAGGHG